MANDVKYPLSLGTQQSYRPRVLWSGFWYMPSRKQKKLFWRKYLYGEVCQLNAVTPNDVVYCAMYEVCSLLGCQNYLNCLFSPSFPRIHRKSQFRIACEELLSKVSFNQVRPLFFLKGKFWEENLSPLPSTITASEGWRDFGESRKIISTLKWAFDRLILFVKPCRLPEL